ncbi:DUF2569 family protein [Emcibacter sp. SYSU 3D8]|uniref:DUF2569 family protein n=1 Tax=Emcibacter sp. SYSU 3D8 TaxID=3133969 RepID=UPI0031FE7037
MNWTSVTEDEAMLHPLYGFGGWLYAVYAVEVLGLALTLEGIVRVVDEAGAGQLANPGFGLVWLQVLLNLPFLLMAPMKARAMPAVAIGCYWVGMVFSLGMVVTLPSSVDMDASVLARVLVWFVWGAVFTLYLLRSRRVNVTYRHRVPAGNAPAAALPVDGVA